MSRFLKSCSMIFPWSFLTALNFRTVYIVLLFFCLFFCLLLFCFSTPHLPQSDHRKSFEAALFIAVLSAATTLKNACLIPHRDCCSTRLVHFNWLWELVKINFWKRVCHLKKNVFGMDSLFPKLIRPRSRVGSSKASICWWIKPFFVLIIEVLGFMPIWGRLRNFGWMLQFEEDSQQLAYSSKGTTCRWTDTQKRNIQIKKNFILPGDV